MSADNSISTPIRGQRTSVTSSACGRRLDNFIISQHKCPKSLVYRLIRKGAVRVNRKRSKADYRLQEGDVVYVPELRQDTKKRGTNITEKIKEKSQELSIIYEDSHCLVIDKPPGLASQPGSGIAFSAIDLVRALRPDADMQLAHRIDRGTSGCLMFSKHFQCLRQLHCFFKNRTVNKTYIAVLSGHLPQRSTTVDEPLKSIVGLNKQKQMVVSSDGKAAQTHFKEIKRNAKLSIVSVQIDTGRMHQIRAHAHYLGCPILGDAQYGNEFVTRNNMSRKLYLHAHKLRCQHPVIKDAEIHCESQLPIDFKLFFDTKEGSIFST